MFEKVIRGRASHPWLQPRAVTASIAAHALCTVAAVCAGAAASARSVERATMLVLYNHEALAGTPSPFPPAAAAAPLRRGGAARGTHASHAPARRAAPARPAVERALPPPTLTVNIPPPGGPELEAAALRGIGLVGPVPDAGAGSSPGTADGGGAPLVDSEILAMAPELLNRREVRSLLSLRYPVWLRDRGIEGEVLVAFIIGVDGRAEMENSVVLSATNPAFVRPALEGLRRMRFRPAELNGVRVRVRASLPMVWVMEG